MSKNRFFLLIGILVLILAAWIIWPRLNPRGKVQAATDIYASPIQGGCYIAAPGDCRIHLDPFTINIASGTRLVLFQLIASPQGGSSSVIYDWRPDQSNPAPLSGSTYSPSLVAQDFAAACGKSYTVNLQGRDTGDSVTYNLGSTGLFTCPASVP